MVAERQRGLEGGAVARPPARASAPPSASHIHLFTKAGRTYDRTVSLPTTVYDLPHRARRISQTVHPSDRRR